MSAAESQPAGGVGSPAQPVQPVQAPAPSAQSPPVAPASPQVATDSLTCQWQSCGERCATAEQLYDHVCERHVGRKSTNNLNLTCQWGNCRTTTVKRDHITSHIRVHVPLKPHKCDFCGKAFKRPQDLKKHVKTHADDSVLLRSPEPSRAQHSGGGSYSSNNGKPSGLYPDNGFGSNGAYGSHSAATNGGGYYSSAPQNSAYGPVYYAQPNALATDSYEMRKRATYDALNEFFGDVKKRQIDPSVYYDVGQRLMGIQGVQLPMLSGGYHGGNDYSGGPGVATAHAPVHQTQYQLPLPNLRTKNDLVNIDQFLEALQSTVYENPNQAAAAGVQQAGAHYLHPQVGYRSSNSPPGSTHGHIGSSHASAMASMSAPATDTPALTPASSVLSYTSGHSPGSVGSGNTISPTTRSNMGSMYPTLPSVSAMDVSGNYTATSNAPSSSLGTSFDAEGRRRYSGPLLQKARRSSDQMDLSEDSLSPKEDSRRGSVDTTRLTAVDPALGGLKSPGSSSSHDVADRDQETWVENIRTIEQLREYIKHRLEQGDFMDEDEEMKDDKSAMDDAQSLYPVLRAVQDD